MQNTYGKLIKGIGKFFKESGMNRVVIGVSGGIDSSLVLKLAVDALGSEKVTALSLPENGVSSTENIMHAKKLSEALGVEYFSVPINQFLVPFSTVPWEGSPVASQNLKARIRMTLLYHYANVKSALVLGTSNKSEMLLGYGTKHGDLACDINVLGDMFKEDVVNMANFVGLPPEIIKKVPSAELYPEQTDEADLGGTYTEIDPILKRLDQGMEALIERGMSAMLVHNIFGRIEKNRHKSQLPPIIKITSKQQ